jgi:hypothetical protein
MDVEQFKSPPEPSVLGELRALVVRAQGGDATALPRIRDILDERPEVWQHLGDLSAVAERAWITVLAADNPLAVESMKRTVAEMKADLAGEQPTRLERMLVDQVLACWMEAKYLEALSADLRPGSLDQASFRLKRLESAEKRYLNAVKTLIALRSLLPKGLAPSPTVRLYEPLHKAAEA